MAGANLYDRLRSVRAWLAFVIAALACCNVNAQAPIGVVSKADVASTNLTTVPFVSLRTIEEDRRGLRYYGGGRGELSLGECTVDLNARKRRQITGLHERTLDRILRDFDESAESIVVYVHGYNMGFDGACRDAALLQEKVGLENRLLLFSWPAEDKVARYLSDVGSIEWSVMPFRDFLVELMNRVGPRTVDLIGHSLGAKGVVEAALALGKADGRSAEIGRVILIAPDLDRDIFLRDLTTLTRIATAVTVYVSAQDRALKASRNVRGEPRLGEGGPELSNIEGVDVVDVLQKRKRFGLRHEYHLHDPAAIADLQAVLSGFPRRLGSRRIVTGAE